MLPPDAKLIHSHTNTYIYTPATIFSPTQKKKKKKKQEKLKAMLAPI